MCSIETFDINLKALNEGKTIFKYALNNDYFKQIDAAEPKCGELKVELVVDRLASVFNMKFRINGIVQVACDICLEDMTVEINTENKLIAELGNIENNEADDEHIIVDPEKGTLNISWLIYEFISLSIPIRHVHQVGKCNKTMLEKINNLKVSETSANNAHQKDIDPRWSKLEKLKNKIKE